MSVELARIGGAVAALGVVVLYLAPARLWRVGGLAAWAAGCAVLAAWLAPSGHHRAYAAAAVAGLVVSVLLAWLFVRVPWLLAVAVLACAPARIPVSVGSTKANLLLPLYVIVAGAVLALAWELLRGDVRSRELGPFAWPAALFVGWSGLALLWSQGGRDGSAGDGGIYLLFYVLPFAVLALSLARLPWRIGWVAGLYVQLTAMVLVFAVIGIYQYLTRNIYFNPKVKVDNIYTPVSWFYRVNSVFYDPSIYGRFLVVGILASIVYVLFEKSALAWIALGGAVVTWLGLVPSFSQSSFVSLGVGTVVALAVFWRRRAAVPLAVAALLLAGLTLGVPQLRHRVLGKAGLNHATSGRSNLVSKGVKIVVHHPLVGVGTGGFVHAYAKEVKLRGKNPKSAASHTSAITVAVETGLPGLALYAWLVAVAFMVPFRRNPVTTATGRARLAFGLALIAIVVHSLFYNALFEDPLFWALIALSAVAVRDPETT